MNQKEDMSKHIREKHVFQRMITGFQKLHLQQLLASSDVDWNVTQVWFCMWDCVIVSVNLGLKPVPCLLYTSDAADES